jgi:hypothetical protein
VKPVTHALPPRGARQRTADMTAHFVRPRRLVLQHATIPDRPQVDWVAHRMAWCIAFFPSRPAATSAFSVRPAHRT